MSNYRGPENLGYRNQMTRPKGRGGMFKHAEQMSPNGRGRYMQNIQIPGQQQPPYSTTATHVGFHPRSNQYVTPEFSTVQYTQQVSAPLGNWSQSIPIVPETFQLNQHSYQPQHQPVYSPEPPHMIPIPNNSYSNLPQVQNQNEFNPLLNVSICSKCGFLNALAHVQLTTLSESNKKLQEQLRASQEQVEELQQQLNANYKGDGSCPSPQTTVQQSSLSVDAQPFHMVAQVHSAYQGTNVLNENSTDVTSRSHNPNGTDNEYPSDNQRSWQQPYGNTPVVSASDITNDQYEEPTADSEYYSHSQATKSDSSEQPLLDQQQDQEAPNVSATENWDQSEHSQQENVVMSSSGSFVISSQKHEGDNCLEVEQNPNHQNDDYSAPKEEKNLHENTKSRPKEQRSKQSRNRGGRNDGQEMRDSDSSRTNSNNRRGSGGSNATYYRSMSPQNQKERQGDKSIVDSRDSSQSRPKSGPDHTDKLETDAGEVGEKRIGSEDRNVQEKRIGSGDRNIREKGLGSGDRNAVEERVDSVDRNVQDKRVDPGDRHVPDRRGDSRDKNSNNRRGGGGGSRRFPDHSNKSKGSEDSNWRQTKEQDSRNDKDDRTRDRTDNYPRTGGYRSGDSFRKGTGSSVFKVVTEQEGDLFSAPPEYSLAHCVAEDLRMGSGIAVNFKTKFKMIDELLEQKKRPGQVAVLDDKQRFIYYLITKKRSNMKPTWSDFTASVEELKRLAVDAGVKNLAMPRIGCGLDRLDWRDVKRLLDDTFSDTGISIIVYNFQQNDELDGPASKPRTLLFFEHHRKNLVDIDPETGLIFLCTEEFSTNRTIDSLDKKHKMMYEYRSAKRTVGEVITIQKGKEYLYGLVVKKSEKDPLSYLNLGKCLRKLRNTNSKDKYGFFGMEAFRDEKDSLTMEKIITSIRNIFGGVQYRLELHICWPKDFENDHHWDDQYTPTK